MDVRTWVWERFVDAANTIVLPIVTLTFSKKSPA